MCLKIKGKGTVQACTTWIDNNEIRKNENGPISFYGADDCEIEILFNLTTDDEIAYVKIKADSDCEIISGYYQSPINNINDVDLAICICTFKREEYIKKNIENLSKSSLFNSNSKSHVFICDNAKTLADISYDWVTVLPNRNVGGSGGFTRCMVEVKKSKRHFTHILLMDDDINLDSQVVERTINMIKILKPEHKNDILGGSMMVLHEPWIQFENGGLYKHGFMQFPNKMMDLRNIRSIIINSRINKLNYNAWCYCCMPTTMLEKGLPLPLFIHMDDIEYGTREKHNIITMNGIGVWHPFFANQRQSNIVYYDMRNKMIVLSRNNKNDVTRYSLTLLNGLFNFIYRYDYNRFLAACDGFDAYLDGIDHFKKIDPEKLNKSLSKYKTKWIDVPDIDNYEISQNKPFVAPKTRKDIIYSILSIGKKTEIYLDNDITQANPNGHRKMILVNRITGKIAVFEKNPLLGIKCLIRYLQTRARLKTKALKISKEWNQRFMELTTDDYWNEYLCLK